MRADDPSACHWPYLALGILVPVLAVLLEVRDERQVGLRIAPAASPLPELCLTRRLFEFPCPGCGLTRSIIHLVHGRLSESLAMHRLGWLVFALIAWQVPWRLWRLAGGAGLPDGRLWEAALWLGLFGLLILNRAWDLLASIVR